MARLTTDQTIAGIEPLVQAGELDEAHRLALAARQELQGAALTKRELLQLARVAGLLIDIGAMRADRDTVRMGLRMLTENGEALVGVIERHSFLYCVANGKSSVAEVQSLGELSFGSIGELVEIKNSFWRAVKEAGQAPPEYLVNLGNALKQQFRIVEALDWYEHPASLNIAQAHLNRADALKQLNAISHSYSIKLLDEVVAAYNIGASLCHMPQQQREFQAQADYAATIAKHVRAENGIAQNDNHQLDKVEFARQSAFRRFCISERLGLSEHSLYCDCAASARDNLTIPTSGGVAGDFIVPMEAVLNRLKSEYAFCRRLYYEYLHHDLDEDLLHESCFSELSNGELLGIEAEKLRTSFKGCFGILDKIAEAVCELLSLHPKGKIYFERFWQLERSERVAEFDKVKSPGLLALYSIATDLSSVAEGEWSFFKTWRNALEHGGLAIQSLSAIDPMESFQSKPGVILVNEAEFVARLKLMLRLTRSAIFSFVFVVRERGLQEKGASDGTSRPMWRKNFKPFE